MAIEGSPTRLRAVARRMAGSGFFRDLAAGFGARLISIGVSTAMLGYPARKLGPAAYGKYAYAAGLVAYAGVLLSPGLVTWGTREIAQHRPRTGHILTTVNAIQVLLAGIGYALVWILASTMSDPEQANALKICALTLFVSALAIDWVFAGLEINRVLAPVTIIATLATAGLQLMLVKSPANLLAYAALGPAVGILGACISYALLRPIAHARLQRPTIQDARGALRASLTLNGAAALVTLFHHSTTILVRNFVGVLALGYFASALRVFEMGGLVTGTLFTIFVPRLSRLASESPERARHEATWFAAVHVAMGMFLGCAALFEAPTLVQVLFGQQYSPAVPLVRLMGIGIVFNFAICGYTNCLLSFRQDKVMLRVVAVSAAWAVVGGFALVPWLGAFGAAVVYAGLDLAGWLSSLTTYRRIVGSLLLKVWVWPVFGGIVIAGVSWALQVIHVAWPLRAFVEVVAYWAIIAHSLMRMRASLPAPSETASAGK